MRIAVICARYGIDIVGGAETLSRGLMERLVLLGHHGEVWTTCAYSHHTWHNVYPPGVEQINGVQVRRFEIDPWDAGFHRALTAKLISSGQLPVQEQYKWIESGPTSWTLYKYVKDHALDFDAIIVIPFVNTLTCQAAFLVQDRLIVWPCLHDEIYAYLEPIRLLMESANANIFNSPEEFQLAQNKLEMRLPRHAIIGSGVTMQESNQVMSRSGTPYVLYMGRLEEEKNLPLLVEYIDRYTAEGNIIKLVLAGYGSYSPPENGAFHHKGFVAEKDKMCLYANALALCQPSVNESFSLTMMESWLAGRPALVHADCAVTRGHVKRSHGGLWFETYGEFRGALNWLQENPELARRMGQNGCEYVRQNYTWPIVANRFLAIMQRWGIAR
ncbi:MAG: glycosyltransferase [Candidatus Promineifilaceae bacterium]|nr:glycosyltransferase [Candidatus Promineifilaceae bacterium]